MPGPEVRVAEPALAFTFALWAGPAYYHGGLGIDPGPDVIRTHLKGR